MRVEAKPEKPSCPDRPPWSERIPTTQYDVILNQRELDRQNAAHTRSKAEGAAHDTYNAEDGLYVRAERKAQLEKNDASAKKDAALQRAEWQYKQNVSTIPGKACGDGTSVLMEAKMAMYQAQWDQDKQKAWQDYNTEVATADGTLARAAAKLAQAEAAKTQALATATEAEEYEKAAACAKFIKALHDAVEKLCK